MDADQVAEALSQLAGERATCLPADRVPTLIQQCQVRIDQAMLCLLSAAGKRAVAPISHYGVGAVGEGASGALYLGCNVELPGGPLGDTVHAEQVVVANALIHRETGLNRLAVSASPCGHCRQFLSELAAAAELQIIVPGQATTTLGGLLPMSFGPAELDNEYPLLSHPHSPLRCDRNLADEVSRAALQAAELSYAPYSGALAGVALSTGVRSVVVGSYIENAAFNPSLSPLLTALSQLTLQRKSGVDVKRAVLVRLDVSVIDHDCWTERLLAKFAPGVPLEIFHATLTTRD